MAEPSRLAPELTAAPPTTSDPGAWRRWVAPFRGADTRRSVIQVSLTAALFALSWAAMVWSLGVGYWLTLLLAVPTAGFLMRLFMIQHDCGHGSYFRSRKARDGVGFAIGVLTLIPYQYWRRTHAHHHAHAGNLDFRGFGDIDTLTRAEYEALPRGKRLAYRLYRNPLVLLGIGPLFHFVIKHRYPWDIPRSWKDAWASVWWTNLALVLLFGAAIWALGVKTVLLVHLPVLALTTSAGVWLFYVQHQFEETYWHRSDDWDHVEASLKGSSHLILPRPLQWLTAHIGLHHIHHLSSAIPNYRLPECLAAVPELQQATRLRIRDTWGLLTLSLWDEDAHRLISFGDLRRSKTAA
ncbi:MAG: fatty acid desaturase [Acidobacteria bacterium]|nr:fatty acid desaturase [Acidobacteriota bacterium]